MDLNFLEFIVAITVGGCISFGFAAWVYGRWKYKGALLNHACTKVPPSDDARKSAKDIGSFLCRRTWTHGGMESLWGDADGRYGFHAGFVSDVVFGHNRDVIEFIRLCHACGCEVVVREVDTKDIEEEPDTLKEVKTSMRGDWYAGHGGDILD